MDEGESVKSHKFECPELTAIESRYSPTLWPYMWYVTCIDGVEVSRTKFYD